MNTIAAFEFNVSCMELWKILFSINYDRTFDIQDSYWGQLC